MFTNVGLSPSSLSKLWTWLLGSLSPIEGPLPLDLSFRLFLCFDPLRVLYPAIHSWIAQQPLRTFCVVQCTVQHSTCCTHTSRATPRYSRTFEVVCGPLDANMSRDAAADGSLDAWPTLKVPLRHRNSCCPSTETAMALAIRAPAPASNAFNACSSFSAAAS